ncbi:hypothetical protein PRZ48_006687 [Zasmidium cellare]|uniref:Chloride channel protein n=1 Tax=Zasmidium cellare TaxID=395010 RepID=A0ABR0ENT0_ZASCE|nr:hypothetical protein PRZ48_006687 [Zasmidium cellare]
MPNQRNDDDEDYEINEQEAEAIRNAYRNAFNAEARPLSPVDTREGFDASRRRMGSSRRSDGDLRLRVGSRGRGADERTGLLSTPDLPRSGYRTTSVPGTPRYGFSRKHSYINSTRGGSRRGSFAKGLMKALGGSADIAPRPDPVPGKRPLYWDDRVWYDQFTSTDWVHDSIADAYRMKELRNRKDFWGRTKAFFDGAQGWLLVFIIGCVTAAFAYVIDVTEAAIFDIKSGYCTSHWWYSKRQCCSGASICDSWHRWSNLVHHDDERFIWTDYGAYVLWCVVLSLISCVVTLRTKTTISSAISLSTLDENLGADHHRDASKNNTEGGKGTESPTSRFQEAARRPPVTYYPAAGSGVAEVRVILSGFVLHGYLGVRTLLCKTIGLILSVASGLSIGKEGPYVHIATCIGNIATRLSSKYRNNDAKRREVLSASAAAGVAVAFGAPIGGVLFSLEEVSYYFPPKTLFRTFFCCIAAALSLKALNPYGTNKIVLFEVRYLVDWKFFEIIAFACLGILGGALGALFIKASKLWAKTFRRIGVIKNYPLLEVLLVALLTGLVSFWNRYTRLPVAELLYEMSAPCSSFSGDGSAPLCPTEEKISHTIWYLCWAFVVKAFLTTVTFGIKVPAGIYVPSMVVGGLLGRIVGHIVQLLTLKYPDLAFFAHCEHDGNPESCVVPGVYALVAAGATMCGVTRLSVTLAVILFELTGSLEHVLPFSLGVLIAKWTADAIEPLSIYDLLTDMNAYPYLDHKVRPVFTTDLGDITPEPTPNRYIDISASPLVPAKQLRFKLEYLHMSGEIDGGLPILKDGILVGLIPGPDLEYALDRLPTEEDTMCLMNAHDQILHHDESRQNTDAVETDDDDDATAREGESSDAEAQRRTSDDSTTTDPTDFNPYIDPSPVALDITSPMDLVYECFVKLGLRYICVLYDGKYAGMVHKKSFVRYVKHVHDEDRKKGGMIQRGF